MKNIWDNVVLRFIGVPILTLLLFIFESNKLVSYVYVFIGYFALSVILWEGSRWISRLLDRYIRWEDHLIARIVVQFGIGLTITGWLTYVVVIWLYKPVYESHYEIDLLFKRYFLITSLISILYNTIHSGRSFFTRWKTSLIETERLKRENLLIEYETLKNQINPHFLFNSLNTLIGLIDMDKKLAIEYGEHFAYVYRYILENRKVETVSLAHELNIVEKHTFLLKSRFGDNFKTSIKVSKEDKMRMMPPLTLQMLLENVIKHNSVTSNQQVTFEITSVAEGTRLLIRNNIHKKNIMEESTHLGLSNIKKRYSFLTNEHEVTIEEENGFFSVEIPLLKP